MKKIIEVLREKKEEQIDVKGWVVFNRGNSNVRFVTFNDGSTYENLQIVFKGELVKNVETLRNGAAIEVKGKIILTPEGKQPLEMLAKSLEFKNVEENYPLQKQGMSLEFLRTIPHLRHRTQLFKAVFKVRSVLMLELHRFLDSQGFLNVTTPVITGNDAEGAGEAFLVDSTEGGFFGKKASLGVSGQLHVEAYAVGYGDVYTFGPTFRAENSHTQKHAAEFWMLEVESAFYDKFKMIKLVDQMLKTVIKQTMKKCNLEFEFLAQRSEEDVVSKLNEFINNEIKTITYKDAIEELKKVSDRFENKDIEFGLDLATEHERYLAEKLFKSPVAVIDYPKDIKAFYMKLNDDGITIGGFDILVPGIGELLGGSEREDSHKKIVKRIKEMNLSVEELAWYSDLRRFGQKQSTGFGLGFDRLMMYLTGVNNIRDVISYPRTSNNLMM